MMTSVYIDCDLLLIININLGNLDKNDSFNCVYRPVCSNKCYFNNNMFLCVQITGRCILETQCKNQELQVQLIIITMQYIG